MWCKNYGGCLLVQVEMVFWLGSTKVQPGGMIYTGERTALMLNKDLPRAYHALQALSTLFLASLACRPVITIGWGEILLIGLVVVLVLGPLLIRIMRGGGRMRGQDKSRDEE
jgi:hypothetical protein